MWITECGLRDRGRREAAGKMKDKKGYPKTPMLTQMKRLMRRFNLQARKSLGQHFLVDEAVLNDIVAAAELETSDVVLEIGPGLGVLTRELAARAGWVVAVELDRGLASVLRQELASFNNVVVVNEDILKTAPLSLLDRQNLNLPGPADSRQNYKVVANLPYYITAAVLRHLLGASLKPKLMVIMVQKEVAEAIVARAGNMSLLSVSVHFYGEPTIVSYVPASSFYPPPEVDSAILKIMLHPQPVVRVTDEAGFFRLVRAGFSTRRKQLANSLAGGLGLPKAEVLSLLETVVISSQRRAETLTLEEWARLWQESSRVRKTEC